MQDVLSRAKQGDRAALDALLRSQLSPIRSTLWRYLGDRDELDDATQKVLTEVVRSLPSFREESALGTWIHRICVNVAVDQLRAERRTPLRLVADVPETADPSEGPDALDARAALDALRECLRGIDADRRMVFVLHDVEERGAPEIAALLGIPEGTVNSRLRQARTEVRQAMEGIVEMRSRTDGRRG